MPRRRPPLLGRVGAALLALPFLVAPPAGGAEPAPGTGGRQTHSERVPADVVAAAADVGSAVDELAAATAPRDAVASLVPGGPAAGPGDEDSGRGAVVRALTRDDAAPGTRERLSSMTDRLPLWCSGTGTDGERIRVVYGHGPRSAARPGTEDHNPDGVDRLAEVRPVIEQVVRSAQGQVLASARQGGRPASTPAGDRSLRFATTSPADGCELLVEKFEFSSSAYSLSDVVGELAAARPDLATTRRPAAGDLTRTLVFLDARNPESSTGAAGSFLCGVAQAYDDPGPRTWAEAGAAGNVHDVLGPLVALVYQPCYGEITALHEVLHTLGAVQRGAPNHDNDGHCTDDYDIMCYAAGGLGAQVVCPDRSLERLLDCNDDDYFNPDPAPGSYLDTHWNTADSRWMEDDAPRRVVRVSGADRYATAAEVAGSYAGDADTVLLADGRTFADALAAGPAAASVGAPVLLAGDQLPEATRARLELQRPSRVVAVGGSSRVPDDVLRAAARAAGGADTARISGRDRYATARALSAEFFAPPTGRRVYLASGTTAPDALSGGAAAAADEAPLLLTTPDRLPDGTLEELRRLGAAEVVLLGGERAVGPEVERALVAAGLRTTRVSGPDRYATSAAVVDFAFGPQVPAAFVATGTGFADALAAGPFAAPVVLTRPDVVDDASRAALVGVDPDLAVVLGGTAAVDDRVARTLTADVG